MLIREGGLVGMDCQYINGILNTQSVSREQRGTIISRGAQSNSGNQNRLIRISPMKPFTGKAAITIIAAIVVVIIAIVVIYEVVNYSRSTALPSTTISFVTSLPATSTYYPNNTSLNPSISSPNGAPCNGFTVSTSAYITTVKGECVWSGGTLSVYYGSGNSGSIDLSITNADTGTTPIALSSNTTCSTYTGTYDLPAGHYIVEFSNGAGKGSCGNTFVRLSNSSA